MPFPPSIFDMIVVGGGAVGLSIAYELSSRGWRVCVVDRQEFGREASWAGAGIIPPGSGYSDQPPLTPLARLGYQLLDDWSRRLKDETDIDNGWQINGGIYLTWKAIEQHQAEVNAAIGAWQQSGIECQQITRDELEEREPGLLRGELLADAPPGQPLGWYVPEEGQLRNPRHLKALVAACQRRGATLLPNTTALSFVRHGDRITHVVTSEGDFAAEYVCLTAGCWTDQLTAELNLHLPVKPIRGQIVLLRDPAGTPPLTRHVHWNDRYVVPRDDGRVLVGATVEDVGFHCETTQQGTDDLLHYARQVGLGALPVETTWAGLRPATSDGLPLIGRLPQLANTWIASGHFRAGLQMSASTAVLVADLLEDKPPPLDATAFAVERFQR